MNRIRFSVAVALLALEPILAADAQSVSADSPPAKAIDKLVAQQGVTAETPGVAVLVRQPGKLLFKQGYGLADLKSRSLITPQTLFELASVSKTFTATAVLMLHEQGKLSLDDDVRKFIPELPEYRPRQMIRIRDLLHHISGLPDYMAFENVPARNKTYWVNEDYAGMFAPQKDAFGLSFATGQKHEYNNTNYMLLGLVIERVARKSFGTFLRDEIFVPCGMKHTFVYEGPQAVPAMHTAGSEPAIGYEWRKNRNAWAPSWGAPPGRSEQLLTVGDGGIWTNLEDMVGWDAAIRENKLIKAEIMKLALAPSKTRNGRTNPYGLGWSIYPDESGGLYGFGNDGSWGGFRTSYYLYLAADRTTVLLSNNGDFDTGKFWYALDAAIQEQGP